MAPLEEIVKNLRDAGLRATPHRQTLLWALRNVHGHGTAEDLRGSATTIPLPTVYAVLNDLVRAGLVREVRGEDGVMRFDATVARHHHLSCTRCGALADVPCEDVDESDPCIALEDKHGWRIGSAEVTFRGVCPSCSASSAN